MIFDEFVKAYLGPLLNLVLVFKELVLDHALGFDRLGKAEKCARSSCCKVAVLFFKNFAPSGSKHSKTLGFLTVTAHLLQYLGALLPRPDPRPLRSIQQSHGFKILAIISRFRAPSANRFF